MWVGWCRFRKAREGPGARSWGSGGEGRLGKRAEAGHLGSGLGRRTGVPSARSEGMGLDSRTRARKENWGSERQVRENGAVLARTQEALGHPRGRHLLPQIQGREKVELLLQVCRRFTRFCGSPGLH